MIMMVKHLADSNYSIDGVYSIVNMLMNNKNKEIYKVPEKLTYVKTLHSQMR